MKRFFVLLGVLGIFGAIVFGQNNGDFRTRTATSGNWNGTAVWQIYNSSLGQWENTSLFPPNQFTTTVTIRSGSTITGNVNIIGGLFGTSSHLIIDSGGVLNMGSNFLAGPNADFPPFNPRRIARLTINGELTTSNYVQAYTFTLGSTGKFVTGFNAALGWWNTLAPNGVTINGLIEYSGTNQVIPDYNYNDLTISGTAAIPSSVFIDVTGDIINQGTFNCGSFGGIYFEGTNTISGSGSFGTNPFIISVGETSTTTLSISSSNNIPVNYLSCYEDDQVIINPTGRISISTALNIANVSGGLLVESDATNTGSLICSATISGAGSSSIEIQRYQSGSEWHIISSPVSGYGIDDFISDNNIDPNNANTLYAMQHYNSGYGWAGPYSVASPPTTNLLPGVGYLAGIALPANLISFTGSLNQGDVEIDLVADGDNLFHVIGNPYSSQFAITEASGGADYFLNGDNESFLDPQNFAIFLYDPEANGDLGAYIPYSDTEGGDIVQVGQGFFIVANYDVGPAVINPSMQIHDNSNAFFKKSAQNKKDFPMVYLHANSGDLTTAAKVYFITGKTAELDRGYDLAGIGFDTNFRIYTELLSDQESKLYVQSLPDNDFSNLTIPVGIDFTDGGLVNITAESMNLSEKCKAILEDRELGVYTDLKAPNAKYMATVDANASGTGRFFLHTFDPRTVNVNMDKLQNITIFAYNKEIFIQGELEKNGLASLYDISGRMVLQQKVESGNLNTIQAPELGEGIYILHLKVGSNEKVSKLILR